MTQPRSNGARGQALNPGSETPEPPLDPMLHPSPPEEPHEAETFVPTQSAQQIRQWPGEQTALSTVTQQIIGRIRLTHRLPKASGGSSLNQIHNSWSPQIPVRETAPHCGWRRLLPRLTQRHPHPASCPQTHRIGFHVSREEAASFQGLVSSQVDGHHGLLLVLLTQLHHLQGPVCGRDAHRASQQHPPGDRFPPEPLLAVPSRLPHPHPRPAQNRGSSVLSSNPDGHGLTWPSANCPSPAGPQCPLLSEEPPPATAQVHGELCRSPICSSPRAGPGLSTRQTAVLSFVPMTALRVGLPPLSR